MKWMRLFLYGMMVLSITGFLFGCSSEGAGQPLNVSFSTSPAALKPHQSSSLAVKVTSKGKAVKDANVVFEIWRSGEQEPIQLKTKPDNEGTYTLKGEFNESGSYSLIAHVTALGTHEMKTFQFAIE